MTAFSRPGAYDPAWILGAAADLLEEDDDALERVRGSLDAIVVDDAQELTSAAARLLRGGPRPGHRPAARRRPRRARCRPSAAPTRGCSAHGVDRRSGEGPTLAAARGAPPARPAADGAAAGCTRRIGAAGAAGAAASRPTAGPRGPGRRRAAARDVPGGGAASRPSCAGRTCSTASPWSQMAVVVRGQGAHQHAAAGPDGLRRARGGVGQRGARCATRWRSARCWRCSTSCCGLALGDPDADRPRDAPSTSCSRRSAVPTRSALRRLRRALRREELDGGGGRTSDELLAECLARTPTPAPRSGPRRRRRRRVAARDRRRRRGRAHRPRRGPRRRAALGARRDRRDGALGDVAGHRLAADVARGRARRRPGAELAPTATSTPSSALFDAAARYVDRLPQAGPRGVPRPHPRPGRARRHARRARRPVGDAVALLTPQGAAGREWRFVVVAGVQEGVWPDLRLRGSLLGSERLVDVVTGRGQSPAGRRRPRSATTRPGCSSSRSAGPPSGCS